MKSAIVLGARQPYGFMICETLLEQDYEVYAKDFTQWQTEEQKDKWMFIGRNAHLHYSPIQTEENFELTGKIIIVSLIDFYSREETEVHDLLRFLLKTPKFINNQIPIVFITPLMINRAYSAFSQDIENIKVEKINRGGRVLEYHLGEKGPYYRRNEISEWIGDSSGEDILKIIRHFEKVHNIE